VTNQDNLTLSVSELSAIRGGDGETTVELTEEQLAELEASNGKLTNNTISFSNVAV
jgi:cell division protein FtsB